MANLKNRKKFHVQDSFKRGKEEERVQRGETDDRNIARYRLRSRS